MIRIAEEDRDALRFLWFQDPLDSRSSILHFQFGRLVFGLRPSPAILGAVITHHLTKHQYDKPELAGLLQNSLYVDDLVTGANTVDEAFSLYKNARGLMAEASMKLRKWNSNSSEVMKLIQADESNTKINTVDKKASVMEEEESYLNLTQLNPRMSITNYPNYSVYFGRLTQIVLLLISLNCQNILADYPALNAHCYG